MANEDALLHYKEDIIAILKAVDSHSGREQNESGDAEFDAKAECIHCYGAAWGGYTIVHSADCPVRRARVVMGALGVETTPQIYTRLRREQLKRSRS